MCRPFSARASSACRLLAVFFPAHVDAWRRCFGSWRSLAPSKIAGSRVSRTQKLSSSACSLFAVSRLQCTRIQLKWIPGKEKRSTSQILPADSASWGRTPWQDTMAGTGGISRANRERLASRGHQCPDSVSVRGVHQLINMAYTAEVNAVE